MGFLGGSVCYLSGPIEFEGDASSWRDECSGFLGSLDVGVWDPLKKPDFVPDVDGVRQREDRRRVACFEDGEFVRLEREWSGVRDLRLAGLTWAAQCDWMIVNLCGAKTYGTLEEITFGRYKPVFIVCEGMPSMWLLEQLGMSAVWPKYCVESLVDLFGLLQFWDDGRCDDDVWGPDGYEEMLRWHRFLRR